MTDRRSDVLGAAAIAAGSVCFGAVVVLGKVATNRGMPVVPMLVVRFAISAALLAIVLTFTRNPLRPARGEGWKLVVLGVFGYAVEAAFFFAGIERGTAAAITLLFFVYPVLVTLLATALGRGLPGSLVGGSLVAAVTGVAVVVASGGGVDVTPAGIGFALGSAGVYTVYLTLVERVLVRTSSLAGAMVVAAAASGGLAVYGLATDGLRLPGSSQWWPVAGMGAFTAAAFLCLMAGVRRIGAVRTAIIAALEPLVASLFGWVFLDEPLRGGVVGGGVLILAGAIAASLARAGSKTEPVP